jgi:hypothetical protein
VSVMISVIGLVGVVSEGSWKRTTRKGYAIVGEAMDDYDGSTVCSGEEFDKM